MRLDVEGIRLDLGSRDVEVGTSDTSQNIYYLHILGISVLHRLQNCIYLSTY